VTGRWFSPDTPVSSTIKIDRHNITEILLKVALNTINQTKPKPFQGNTCNMHEQILFLQLDQETNFIKNVATHVKISNKLLLP
jgi:hypothetical protein